MVLCMKTTVEIPDKLLARAKRYAVEKRLSLKEVIMLGLKMILEKKQAITDRFTLKDVRVDGAGLNPEFSSAEWGKIRDSIYPIDISIKR
jgi:hypothetical protein